MTTEITKTASPRLPRPDAYAAYLDRILAKPPLWRRIKARVVLWFLDLLGTIAYLVGF